MGKKPFSLFLLLLLVFCFAFQALADGEVLRIGDKGPEIVEMKKRLQALRYIQKGGLTKVFTEDTARALREFQRMNGLPETGELDAETAALLYSDAARALPHPTLPPLRAESPTPQVDWP